MNHTTNYQLSQWERSDKVLMEDFNADNAKLDAALTAQAGTLTEHAEALTAHAGQMAKLGNCAVHVGSYIGKGDSKPVSVTVPGKPMVVFVQDGSHSLAFLALRGMASAMPIGGNNSYVYELVWGDQSISWTNNSSATYSLNYKDRLYFYMVLATMDE